MRLFFYILNKTEHLDTILDEFVHNNINGATIIEGTGMARVLSQKHDEGELPFLSSLRNFMSKERENSKIIFTVMQDEQVDTAVDIIESVVGDLNKDNNGIAFSLPIDFSKGMIRNGK